MRASAGEINTGEHSSLSHDQSSEEYHAVVNASGSLSRDQSSKEHQAVVAVSGSLSRGQSSRVALADSQASGGGRPGGGADSQHSVTEDEDGQGQGQVCEAPYCSREG